MEIALAENLLAKGGKANILAVARDSGLARHPGLGLVTSADAELRWLRELAKGDA